MNRRRVAIMLTTVVLLASPPTPGRAAAPAQGNPRLEVTVYGNTVRWFGSAVGTVLRGELRGPGGLKATAAERGSFPIVLTFDSGDASVDPRILPGDELTLAPEDGPPMSVRVPELHADADAATDRIAGRGPPGASVEVVGYPDEPLGTATIAADGTFALDLAGRRALAPGDSGWVSVNGTGATVFVTRWEVASTRLWLGTGRLELAVSLGGSLAVDLRTPAGEHRALVHVPRGSAFPDDPFRCGDCPRLVAGTVVTVTKRSRVPGMSQQWSGSLPDLDLRLDRAGNAVTLRGEPAGTYTLSADDIDLMRRGRPAIRQDVTTDAAGRFTLDLAGRAVVRPGWVARLEQWPTESVQLVQEDRLRRVRAVLFGSHLEAVVAPNVPVTVTLTGEDGGAKGTAVASSSIDGLVGYSFGVDSSLKVVGPRFAPGDRIQVEEHQAGDPLVLTIPKVTMQSDVAGNRVHGACDADFDIEVADLAGPERLTPPCAGGTYEAVFSGPVVQLNSSGPVIFRQRSGPFELYTGWSATRVEFQSSTNTVGGVNSGSWLRLTGTAGRTVRVIWLTAAGQVIGTYELVIGPSNLCCTGSRGPATILLEDSAGRQARILPGDRFLIDVGDDRLQVVAPPLDLSIDIATDTVRGHTLPNVQVGLGAQHWSLVAGADVYGRKTMSDSSGAFQYDFTGDFDIVNRDHIMVAITTPEGHTAYYYLEAPGLLLDLTEASVVGMTLPDAALSAELRAGATVIAHVQSHTNWDGAFRVDLRDPAGRRLEPAAGQVLTLRAGAGGRGDIQTMTVPELDFALDPRANEVRGRATPGGTLAVRTRDWFFLRDFADAPMFTSGDQARPPILADASWLVRGGDFRRRVDDGPTQATLVPGAGIQAQYQLADGNLVTRTRFVPVVNVEHGGPRVCGIGRLGDVVEARIMDRDGAVVSRSPGVVGDDMRFELTLTDPAGRPVPTRAGQTARVTIGAETVDVALPQFTTVVAWDRARAGLSQPVTRVSGSAPPFRTVMIATEVQGCFTGALRPIRGATAATDESGAFGRWIDHGTGGDGIELAVYTPDHHRYFRHIVRSQLRIFVDTDRVVGRVTASAPITLTLQDATGRELARATAVGGVDGSYGLRFRDAAGQAVTIRAGQRLRLDAPDGGAEVPVEPLTFDFGLPGGLIGVTRPNANPRFALTLADGTTRRFERPAGADGRFRFGPTDVPAREGWSLVDVAAVEAVLPLAGGHEIVAEAVIGRHRVEPVFLPFALGSRRR